MEMIIGVALAIAFGGLQFFLLWRGVRSIAKGQLNVLYFIAQFFCPMVGLGLCAWLSRSCLVLCAGIMCGILLIGATTYYIYTQKR